MKLPDGEGEIGVGGVLFGAGGQHAGAAEDEDGGHHPLGYLSHSCFLF